MYRNLIPVCDMRTWGGDDGNDVRDSDKGSMLSKELNMRHPLYLLGMRETWSWTFPQTRLATSHDTRLWFPDGRGHSERLGSVDIFLFIEKGKSSVYFTDSEQMACSSLR